MDSVCFVDHRIDVSMEEARMVDESICREVQKQLPPGGQYRVRVERSKGKVFLRILGYRSDGARSENEVVLSQLGEVPDVAPRLIEPLAVEHDVPSARSPAADDAPRSDASTRERDAGGLHLWTGLGGIAARGGAAPSGHIGLSAGTARWSFVTDVRAAGGAFEGALKRAGQALSLGLSDPPPTDSLSYASAAVGVRHHLSESSPSFFIGGGLGFDWITSASPNGRYGWSKLGLAGYAELGVDLLREQQIGGAVVARVDLPAFSVTEEQYQTTGQRWIEVYTPVFALSGSFRFGGSQAWR